MSEDFVAGSYAEIDEMERKELEANELVQILLSQPDIAGVGVYQFGTMEIKYKRALTSSLRRLLSKAQKEMKSSDDALGVQDNLVYAALSEICTDAPFNNPNAWKLIDQRSNDGRVYQIFKDLMEQIGAGDQQIKSFRRK